MDNDIPKSVLFVQHTPDSGLAKSMRKVLNDLKPWTNISVKVVERAGERIQDILHKSDPWGNRDCERGNCKVCETSVENEKIPFKNCTKRSVIYMTWYESCRMEKLKTDGDVETMENGEENKSGKEKNKGELREMKRKCENVKNEDFIYIGETSRSAMERSTEHFKDLERLRSKSHMLKHITLHHKESRPEDIKFRIKIASIKNLSALEALPLTLKK